MYYVEDQGMKEEVIQTTTLANYRRTLILEVTDDTTRLCAFGAYLGV